MNPPSMETIFLILSGVILFAGVIYWMWSHLQLTQKKVQLLENAVFELRAMIPGGSTTGPPSSASSASSASSTSPSVHVSSAPAKATTTYNDLADDDWEDSPGAIGEIPAVSTPLETLSVGPMSTPAPTPAVPEITPAPELITGLIIRETEISDDLMPGGRIQFGADSGNTDAEEKEIVPSGPSAEEEFKQLLKSRAAPTTSAASSEAPALEGMPLKELRRLGEQRGIAGAAEMRKKELLAILRSQVTAKPQAVEEHRTLDLATIETDAVEAAALGEADVVMPSGLEEAEILE